MKVLCITGADNVTLAEIAAPFYQAGMQFPKPLQRDRKICFSRWHHAVRGALDANEPVGKLWENIATELVLANLESDCWGWYESKSVDALDFWAELEPNILFLLVCTRPEQELIQTIAQNDNTSEAKNWLVDWFDRHQRMLDFYLKYPQRSLLIDATDAIYHLTGHVAIAHEHWRLPLKIESLSKEIKETNQNKDEPSFKRSFGKKLGHVASLIVRELIKTSKKDIIGLYADLKAAQFPFTNDDNGNAVGSSMLDLFKSDPDEQLIQELLSDFKNICILANERQSLLLRQSELTNGNAKLERVIDEEVRARQQTEETAAERKRELERTKRTLESTKQENELLILQLHQLQEKLESTHLNTQELGNKIQNTCEKLDRQSDESESSQSQINNQTEQALEGAKLENELLQLQLYQVQEELEHYFLKHQQQGKENEELRVRIEKLRRNSGGSVAGSMQVESVKNGFGTLLNWRLEDLDLAGDELTEAVFSTFLKFGQVGIKIDYGKSGELISHWPSIVQTDEFLMVHPGNLSVLENLSSADCKRIMQLPNLLEKAIGQTDLSNREQRRWRRALKRLTSAFQKLPPRLSYESVSLRHEKVNPDYEHLWLALKSPSFGDRSASEWSFRISCANVRPDEFGSQPKIEIPEQSEQLLKNWFAESRDDNGDKLELRFALPDAMDMGVWKKMCVEDQVLLCVLIRQLPSMLNELLGQGRGILRSWDDWLKLVANMQRILNTKLKR